MVPPQRRAESHGTPGGKDTMISSNPTIYYIVIRRDSGPEEHEPLRSTTARGAIRSLTKWIRDLRPPIPHIYLAWYRPADGCRGYINPDGPDYIGVSWTRWIEFQR